MSEHYIAISSIDTIQHFGIKGMKWGVRSRYMLDRVKSRHTYKRELRNAKIKYKQNRPELYSRALKKSAIAALALGVAGRNADMLKYGVSGVAGSFALDKLTGRHGALKEYKQDKRDIKDSYREYKQYLKDKRNQELKEG